ncbi:hypothetical protein ASG17_07550 [Brevundimonas sp. Leaf363]|uniref:DUF2163 domain-containing protein n=1 Tax=Brevundimonas sp. Leaf363 TaxID=1736353 RepID=UPI0006F2FA27|nr:DUF2163 domain-containing protein [Brevundimonas sp. Leaf363]KQS55896.1 hypothetical protein ASG17_07550 [Brevundimonas sp. Leaf363]
MDADLIAELASKAPFTVILVTIKLDGSTTIRWTDGGFVRWGGEVYRALTAWGTVSEVGEISDGVDAEVTSCTLSLMPSSDDAFADLVAPEVQGAEVLIHFGAVDFETGRLVGEPDLLLRAELDEPRLSGTGGELSYDLITEEARMLEANDERRLTNSFHQSVWPGELGLSHVDGLTKKIYWRTTAPNNAIS